MTYIFLVTHMSKKAGPKLQKIVDSVTDAGVDLISGIRMIPKVSLQQPEFSTVIA